MNDKTRKASGAARSETTADAARLAQEALEGVMQAGNEALDATVKAATEATTEAYEAATTFGPVPLEQGAAACRRSARAGRENLAAWNESLAAMTAGLGAYGERVTQYARDNTEAYFRLQGQCLEAKTPAELARLQVEAMTQSLGRLASQSVELNRIAFDALGNAWSPLSRQYAAGPSGGSKPAAE